MSKIKLIKYTGIFVFPVVLILLFITVCSARPAETPPGIYPSLTNKFYQAAKKEPFWIPSAAGYPEAKRELLQVLDNSKYFGLNPDKYHYSEIENNEAIADTNELKRVDRLFTDAIIALSKDVYQGANISNWIKNDEISGKYANADNDYVIKCLVTFSSVSRLTPFFEKLTPQDAEYTALAAELKTRLDANDKKQVRQLSVSLNFYRWIHHFHFEKYIVVNIPSARLRYYESGQPVLQMKVVVGKPSTRTPRLATWCNQVILYPYWNVPQSIAVKEMIPKFRKNPGLVDELNMQVVDKNGGLLDASGINWNDFDDGYFPFIIRQCTGCENSLGVIKFNLTDPFDVYMHDTNFKPAFSSVSRYMSHGCIRLQQPIELANYLLENKLDEGFLKACIKGQEPVINKLKAPVPVFVVYMTATTDSVNNVTFVKDVYHLF